MTNHELYQRLLTEASSIRPEMGYYDILAVENRYLRAFAMLVARSNFRCHPMRELAKTVDRPEAGEFGRRVQEEVQASYKFPTVALEKAFEKRRRAHREAMDGLLVVPALAQGAFDLHMAGVEAKAA